MENKIKELKEDVVIGDNGAVLMSEAFLDELLRKAIEIGKLLERHK